MKILNYLILFICLPQFVSAQKVNWSIIRNDGELCLNLRAKEIEISEDYVWYKEDSLYGLKDFRGNVILNPYYKNIKLKEKGFTEVYRDGCWGMVKNGKEIIPVKNRYFVIRYDKDSIIAFEGCSPEGREDYIIEEQVVYDYNGNKLSQSSRCDQITTESFNRDGSHEDSVKLPGSVKKYCNLLNDDHPGLLYAEKPILNNFRIFEIQEYNRERPCDDYYCIGILNRLDSIIFESHCANSISEIHNGFFCIQYHAPDSENLYLLMDTTGTMIGYGFEFLRYNQFSNSLIFGKDNNWGYINSDLNYVYLTRDKRCSRIIPVNKNFFLLDYDNYGTSLVTSVGKETVSLDSGRFISGINQNCILIKKNNHVTFSDLSNKFFDYAGADGIINFDYGRLIERPGRRIPSGCEIDGIPPMASHGKSWDYSINEYPRFFVVEKDSLKGVFDADLFKEIIKPVFDAIYRISDSHFAVKKNSTWGIVDSNGKVIVPVECTRIRNFDKYYAISKEPFDAD